MVKKLIDDELFNILICPVCKSGLKYSKDQKELICTKCSKRYQIKEGIPVLI